MGSALLDGLRPTLCLLGLLALSVPAAAVDARHLKDSGPGRGLSDELDDMGSGSKAQRRYAVRNLRKMTRSAIRQMNSRNPEAQADALLFLEDLDRHVAPRCIEALANEEQRLGCAEILGLLETPAALGPLEARLEQAASRREERVLRVAITRIEAAETSS